MRLFVFLLFFIVFGCNQAPKHTIEEVDLTSDVYDELLTEIQQSLEKNPEDHGLIYKKFYVSKQLHWPMDISEDIAYLMAKDGLTPELYRFSTDFYVSSRQYDNLLKVVDQWLKVNPRQSSDLKLKVLALNGLNRPGEAKQMLWELLQKSSQPDDMRFVASEYLSTGDTVRAMYAFNKLKQIAPEDTSLLNTYVPLLLETGYTSQARDVLMAQSEMLQDYQSQLFLAKTLFKLGDQDQAFDIIKQYDQPDAYFQLADLYHKAETWDSAVLYVNKVIEEDSSRSAVFKKGQILEDRGWLNSSLAIYEQIISKDPADTIALERTEIVKRKIAYLRRLREREREIPLLDLTPKKSTENE